MAAAVAALTARNFFPFMEPEVSTIRSSVLSSACPGSTFVPVPHAETVSTACMTSPSWGRNSFWKHSIWNSGMALYSSLEAFPGLLAAGPTGITTTVTLSWPPAASAASVRRWAMAMGEDVAPSGISAPSSRGSSK